MNIQPVAVQNQAPVVSGVPAQPPAENPLDQLRDIHLPDQIDQFPYAPGWWFLLAIVSIALGFFIYRKLQYRKAIRLLVPAREELELLRALPKEKIDAQAIATLSGLLKRICLVYFPKRSVAALSGSNWLAFLSEQYSKRKNANTQALFSEQDVQLFSQSAYQKSPNIEVSQWHQLIDSSDRCIEAIITYAASSDKKRERI